MTENVSGIGYTSTSGVTSSTGNSKNSKPEVEEEKKETQHEVPAKAQMTPDQVYAHLAALGVYNAQQVQGGYDVSKYVSPEEAERIASFVTNFEAAVAQGLIDIEEEFGDFLSEEAKLALAAAMAG